MRLWIGIPVIVALCQLKLQMVPSFDDSTLLEFYNNATFAMPEENSLQNWGTMLGSTIFAGSRGADSKSKWVYTPSPHVKQWTRDHTSLWRPSDTGSSNFTRPPLDRLLPGGRIKQPESRDMLDFAIVGHGKCGSTTMLAWLRKHADCATLKGEVSDMSGGNTQALVTRLYNELPDGPHIRRGYKFPQDIRNPRALSTLKKNFPETLLLVGIRHPVLWWESFYNFKVQNLHLDSSGKTARERLGHPNKLIDHCIGTDVQSVRGELGCLGTGKGRFHLHLAYLQKHNATNLAAQALVQDYLSEKEWSRLRRIPNPIFLVDSALLSADPDQPERIWQLKRDLQTALGLPTKFARAPGKVSPGRNWNNSIVQQEKDTQKIDICEDEFIPVRRYLLELSQNISTWIRTSGFLDHPTVMVSSRDHFEEHLRTSWMVDPCDKRTPRLQ